MVFLRYSPAFLSLFLRSEIAPPPTLHRLCTDFGTEDHRRINGLT